MGDTSRRPLVVPIALVVCSLAALVVMSFLTEWLHLAPDRPAALFLHYVSGIWMWLALAWLAARCCDLLLQRLATISRNGVPYPRLLTDLIRAALFAAAAMTILLLVFEQPATGLITVSSVLIAVIGFALRNVISDIFSGIALGIDHPYAIGDWIETVQGSAGKVSEITWRTTRLIDRNGFAIVVPNGLVAGQKLINYGNDETQYRTLLRIPLDPAVPVTVAKGILLSGALDAGRRFPGLSPDVLLAECTDGAATYVVRFRVLILAGRLYAATVSPPQFPMQFIVPALACSGVHLAGLVTLRCVRHGKRCSIMSICSGHLMHPSGRSLPPRCGHVNWSRGRPPCARATAATPFMYWPKEFWMLRSIVAIVNRSAIALRPVRCSARCHC